MENYQRFVSYIFSYNGQKKCDNVGFARLECREGIVKLYVHLNRIAVVEPHKDIILVDKNNKHFLIGTTIIKNGQLEYRDVMQNGKICGDGDLAQMAGLVIANHDSNDIEFATIWVEEDFDIFRFQQPEAKENANDNEKTDILESDSVSDDIIQENCIVESQEISEEKAEEHDNIISSDCQCEKVIYKPEKEEFYRCFGERELIDAFSDDEYERCIDISPDDLKHFPRHLQNLKNNSFFMHGYYNFRHILLAKKRDYSDRYMIGVPGMYKATEKIMANMYGFEKFKASHRADMCVPCFGYWYIEVSVDLS